MTPAQHLQSAAWHSMPASRLKTQNDTVLALFEPQGRDWTLGELVARLRADGVSWAERSTVNRVLDSLKAAKSIQHDSLNGRKCTVTKITVTRYYIGAQQRGLFN